MTVASIQQTSQNTPPQVPYIQTASYPEQTVNLRAGPNQGHIEDAILHYQETLKTGSQRESDAAYDQACRLYPPLNFIHVWHKKYSHLYDSKEDFVQEYLFKFCKVLQCWKPRHLRGESRYGGKGTFANYFWGALDKMYSNQIKAQAAAKRCMGIRCPICDLWCNPLSTHILTGHPELLFDQVADLGIDLNGRKECPLCKSHHPRRLATCPHTAPASRGCAAAPACDSCLAADDLEVLKKHFTDKHSSLLFERFRNLYPGHVTLSVRPISVNTGEDDEGNERDLYDTVSHDTRLEDLLDSDLSPVQRQIVESVVVERATALVYDPAVYKVSAGEFALELAGLKSTMALRGWDKNEDDD